MCVCYLGCFKCALYRQEFHCVSRRPRQKPRARGACCRICPAPGCWAGASGSEYSPSSYSAWDSRPRTGSSRLILARPSTVGCGPSVSRWASRRAAMLSLTRTQTSRNVSHYKSTPCQLILGLFSKYKLGQVSDVTRKVI